MKIQINGTLYSIDEGSTITDNYNETLDSATIRISHLPSELNIEPFDDVILIDDQERINNKYLIIDDYVCTEQGLYDVKTYTYEINLVSPTKAMEGIILPNLSITSTDENKTILYYLQTYLSLYGPKVRRYIGGSVLYRDKWHYSNDILTNSKFLKVCPEMQWNIPTLREVITDLLMVVDCIPVITRNNNDDRDVANEINFIDLTKKGKEVSKYNYITKSQSSADYISELQMQMQNVLQTKSSNLKQTVSTVEFLTFTSDDYVINSDNMILKTEYPIMRIKHLYMYIFPVDFKAEDNQISETYTTIYKVDLSNMKTNSLENGGTLIYEKQAYDKLNILYRTISYNDSSIKANNVDDYFSQNQNYCIYYTRGSNVINGFSRLTKGVALEAEKPTLYWLKAIAMCQYDLVREIPVAAIQYADITDIVEGDNEYFTTLFQIEYETSADLMFRASKSEKPKNNRITIDGQSSSFVDSYNQGNLEYQKANRLGNQSILINQRLNDDYEDLIAISDTKGDNIVYQTQYQIYDNHIEVNARATKNFILRDYFTGVKSKIRTFSYAREEAFIRHDIDKYYIELSETIHIERISLPTRAEYFTSPLTNGIIGPIKYGAVSTSPSYNVFYAVNEITRVVGKSLVFTVGFNDNIIISKYVDPQLIHYFVPYDYSVSLNKFSFEPFHLGEQTSVGTNEYGGVPTQYYTYVDDYGKFTYITITLFESLSNIPEELEEFNQIDDYKQIILDAMEKPKINYNDIVNKRIEDTFYVYKDTREIPRISLQFEFCSDTINMYITRYFIENQRAIRNNNILSYTVYYENSDYYIYNKEKLTDGILINNAVVSVDGTLAQSSKLTITFNNMSLNKKAFYIVDSENNIWLGINKATSTETTNTIIVYFNLLKDRDKNIYDDDNKPIEII